MATASPLATTPGLPPRGVDFPLLDGARSTSTVGRAIIADAAQAVDSALAAKIAATTAWRRDYIRAFRDITVAASATPQSAASIAEAGLTSMHSRMVHQDHSGIRPLSNALQCEPRDRYCTEAIIGTGSAIRELRVPYRGRELAGAQLLKQVQRWVQAGTVEPSVGLAIERVVAHPEWLSVPGRSIAVLGAGAEMGPLKPLLAWGAHVLAIDLPDAPAWTTITAAARQSAGTLSLPIDRARRRGIDVLTALPETRAWLTQAVDGRDLVLGMYAYADRGTHVRLSAAADALAEDLLRTRPATALAYLATPTDAFVVPADAVAEARRRWQSRGSWRGPQALARALSRGALFQAGYADGTPVVDVLVPAQGPNYALAKRLQRWRGIVAEQAGHTVSFNVAPATWTRSVTKNRTLAAAYAGAHRFDVEIFDADTSRALMAALLVHDLQQPPVQRTNPDELFSDGAAHGGLWRRGYEPRSVLSLAALIGLPSTLHR